MTEVELQSLLAPLPGSSPCGPDLQFDADYLALEEAAAGQPEQEYGKLLLPAKGPDWRAVNERALQLATRSRDLRLAVWLVRSGARAGGLGDAVRGLQLVQGLLEHHWDSVHPALNADDPAGEISRVNAFSPLQHANAALADLRAARLTSQRGALTVREIELAHGAAEPLQGEAVPTRQGVLAAIAAACVQQPELPTLMHAGIEAVRRVGELLAKRLGSTRCPDLQTLSKMMRCLDEAASASADSSTTSPNHSDVSGAIAPHVSGEIASREDAIRELGRVCDWIELHEPASPAPIFIRRSQQLMQKGFIDIIRDLLPDNVKQIEHFAGKSLP